MLGYKKSQSLYFVQ